MGIVEYNGKKYYEPENDTLKALHEVNIHTFRYYPQEKLMICSDEFSREFHCEKFYPEMPKSLADNFIHEKDRDVLYEMAKSIDLGHKKTTAILRTRFGGKVSRVTITAIEWDEKGAPLVCAGVVEDHSEDIRDMGLIRALGSDYESVYYVDFEKNAVYPYRMSESIEQKYGEFLKTEPRYEDAILSYIRNTVCEAERDEMMRECAYENLKKQLTDKDVYMHDYQGVWEDKISYFRMKVVNLSAGQGLQAAVIGFADVSKEKRKEIERYAYVDPVTGGDNYYKFKNDLREINRPGFIVSMDIHAFKIVNSVCGISKGDEALKGIWECVQNVLNMSDRAGHINADHFVLFIETDSEEEVTEKLNKITEALGRLSIIMEIPQLIPYFGIAKWVPERKIEESFSEATAAKHDIKDNRKCNHAFYSQIDTDKLLMERQLEDAFETAIKNRNFEVWYQPKYSPENRTLVGAEALVRWRKSDGSLISPGVFIPLFERNGMIKFLDEYVFRTVCEQQKKWQSEGKCNIPISINLSRASLYFQKVVEQYRSIVEEVGIDPKSVPIEITESAAVANEDIQNLARSFFDAGFPLHMDDFGTGYSSLATLNIMHFDTLKIDKSLIDFIGNYGGDRLLLHTIALAKELGMHVTAEGVENKEQVDFLQALNCDSIQGFYYSRPLPLQEFEEVLA